MMAETLKTVEAVTPEKIIKTSQIEVELKHTLPPVFLNISSVIRAIKKEIQTEKAQLLANVVDAATQASTLWRIIEEATTGEV